MDNEQNYFYWYAFKNIEFTDQDNIWALIRILQDIKLERELSQISLLSLYRYSAIEGQKQKVSQGPYYYGMLLMSNTLNHLIENIESTCSICFELMSNIKKWSCGHIFCENCSNQWSKQNNKCPFCRTENKTNNIFPVINGIKTFPEEKVSDLKNSNSQSVISRIHCSSYFEAIKWLNIALQLDDDRAIEFLIKAYNYVGDIENSLKDKYNPPDMNDPCIAIIKNLFSVTNESNLTLKNYDQIIIFERYLLHHLKSIPLSDSKWKFCINNRSTLYQSLLEKYTSVTDKTQKINIINILLYLISESYDHIHLQSIICCFSESHSLSVIAKKLISSHPVFFRYGLFLLDLLSKKDTPIACIELANLYSSGYSREGNKYHPKGISINEDKQIALNLAKKIYQRGYCFSYRDIEPNLDFKTYFFSFWNGDKEIKQLFYQRYDLFSTQIKVNDLSMNESLELLLDFVFHNPKGIISNYQLALFLLFKKNDLNSGLFYLKKAVEYNNIEAEQLWKIYEILGSIEINEEQIIKPILCSTEKFDQLYQKFIVLINK